MAINQQRELEAHRERRAVEGGQAEERFGDFHRRLRSFEVEEQKDFVGARWT